MMGTPDQNALNVEEVARATLSLLVTELHELTGIRIKLVRMSDGQVAATHRLESSVILGTTAKRG